jgi:hypothetical protein
VALVFFVFPKACGPSKSDQVTEESKETLRGKLHDALLREVAAKRKAEQALHSRGVSLRHAADTVKDLPSKILFLQQACHAFQQEAVNCQERADLLQVRIDTLESALRKQIGVTGCKVVFLACPTRMQSAGVALLVGGFIGWALHP